MRKCIWLIAILLTACQHKAATITLSVNKAQGDVKVTGIAQEILYTLKADSVTNAMLQNLFPISAMPADTEMKNYQRPIRGEYQVSDNGITFKPDTPFVIGKTYFARYYIYSDEVNRLQLLQQKTMPGTPTYTELIFKY
ncbi:hypothetical protein [Mucilaginibacter boryungensis]|uniref:Lipoprotein n=1 Tax=Mucilaginibacter boryungensis TaxID=768480 RepID=A0ABR9XMW2_9SPHI|nr:hypothetical protein [Mucilaginibacter boryungensis]MBE9668350.1 hypothetical protein [Mucilaginibacter boryungensis]